MAKDILIFSDGTGQIGGMRPDQRLSNVYKMYRAMRPGPDSPISPKEQVAFYDAGLGAGETGGITFKRIRNFFASAVGTGIDENVIDCYEAIIARYEPGDRIHLVGFSRGAYTVRTVANVLNLCGVPGHGKDGAPLPKYGPRLRKIASDAVRYVYNHGAGKKRDKYEYQREEKARRFRKKYGSEGTGADGEGQGNVQPTFVGVFDTVAALGSRTAFWIAFSAFMLTLVAAALLALNQAPVWITVLVALLPLSVAYWVIRNLTTQFKYFFEDESRRISLWKPWHWIAAFRHGHMAWWSGKNYDWYIDREVRYLRHALSIDETRTKFPRVKWGRGEDYTWNNEQNRRDWMKQVWFAGNHSDIGGSYPEEESRLSDISLGWMVDELKAAVPALKVRNNVLVTSPDHAALQHDEIQNVLFMQPSWLLAITANKLTWSKKIRAVHENADLHPTVYNRLETPYVPQMAESMPYRPENLRHHKKAGNFFKGEKV
ncbi:MAG: DUF2235 domain-containing protein [Hoeflea sp.]|uniref:DUF2235 domain-containing protein n=1 Tax=Hoeflea sp. TaxID=1940281 RepID=UPI001D6F542B|nr:DUF2235 domain-containing protein [Hoeflea sp.]MBU4527085.1 DUF2235 domain-containing protein [Alphaproteobacteria bacterium]MBU4553325.1 DUF2235 domain-containing protein [Alphaproteobacteria bacterium]MBV1722993.1 DUF2235 domain-containing protein [Hoeflea sp.]MBV1759486.1 DUF2235 domain-containing protein [Hoeflea sp.]MBV1783552.1 DUF2235 domain-containing protein [Hoeflea sp.]